MTVQENPQNYCCAYAKAYWKILTGQGLQDAGQIGYFQVTVYILLP